MGETHAGWNWTGVSDSFWRIPSPDVYFLLHRWRDTARLRLLDLGCGLGRHALLFAKHGFTVTAADVSPSALDAVAQTSRDQRVSLDLVRADAQKLPFANETFDAVLAYHSIYHVDRQGMMAAISEVRRVLKPSAEIYITFISKTAPSFHDQGSAVVDANVRLKREEEGSILPHFYVDQNDLQALLSDFRILSLRQIEDIQSEGSGWHYFVHAGLK